MYNMFFLYIKCKRKKHMMYNLEKQSLHISFCIIYYVCCKAWWKQLPQKIVLEYLPVPYATDSLANKCNPRTRLQQGHIWILTGQTRPTALTAEPHLFILTGASRKTPEGRAFLSHSCEQAHILRVECVDHTQLVHQCLKYT